MKKIYCLFVRLGKYTFIIFCMLITSIILCSFTMKGKVNYGNRCYVKYNENEIVSITYNDVKLLDNYLGCNTYYLEYESNLEEKENLIFLAYLSRNFQDKSINSNFHIIIKSTDYEIISTIVDNKISYTKVYI